MDIHFVYYIYFAVLAVASICSLYRYKYLDTPSKIFATLVCISFLNEILAFVVGRKFHSNEIVYAIYELAEFALTSLYFNYSIDVFKERHIGFYVAIAGIVLGSINILLVQRISSRNSFFMLFESIVIIAMALFAFFRFLLKNEDFKLHTYRHFWFISILIFFWSITFLYWGLYDYFVITLQNKNWPINLFIVIVNIIFYFSVTCVFILYPKLQHGDK